MSLSGAIPPNNLTSNSIVTISVSQTFGWFELLLEFRYYSNSCEYEEEKGKYRSYLEQLSHSRLQTIDTCGSVQPNLQISRSLKKLRCLFMFSAKSFDERE